MNLLDVELDWPAWFARWEAMQNCYVPSRLSRMKLMLDRPGLPPERPVRILDLGCGPGTLALQVLKRHPNASAVAVDFDPLLLTMGQHLAGKKAERIQFVQADIRREEFWKEYRQSFDLIVSATAMHWLNDEHLAAVYRRCYRALKPCGWVMNSDHIAGNDPSVQEQYREDLRVKREAAFRASPAERWNEFWNNLDRELAELDLADLRKADRYWEGSDDGQPLDFHLSALRDCGFEQVGLFWQEAGEAVVGAQKPAS